MTDIKSATSRSAAWTFVPLLRAMRPKQWVKNVFVFAGIVFARGNLLLQPQDVMKVSAAFVFFSLMSSSVYLVNDLVDRERDQQHPVKRFRPIAAGELSPRTAAVVALLLPLACVGVTTALGLTATPVDMGWLWLSAVLSAYFALQLAYSFALKHVVLVDLFVITAGFILRAVGGALVISVAMTEWWLLSLFFLALFLGLGKRRHELSVLADQAGQHRRTLQEYSLPLVDQLLMIDVACTIMVYSQATFTSPLATAMPYPFLMVTIPLVVFALFRYLYLMMQKGEGGEPADLLLRDKSLAGAVALCGFFVLFIQTMRF
ncbi:MAG: decaprenyl-phosphate phosphoribosyltransferase [Chloroflexi bacterium]|nr:decaprenyl-phosphate phosphoribosyltransferase [Chloroflexota bacterium]